jgi:hypothetical protein
MGIFGGSAPKAPDPYKVADAQTKSNIETAREQQRIGMTGVENDQFSVEYVVDPTSPSGYRQVSHLSPELQAILGQSQDLQALYGDIAGEQLGRVGDTLSTPWDMDAARGTEISDIQRTFLDPVWGGREEALKNDLMNRGIREGSKQWEMAIADFEGERSRAYDRMFLDAYTTGNQAALTERNQPMFELTGLRGGYQGPTPGTPQTATPSPGVAPTDVTGPVMQAYNAQVAQHNAGMGGLFGLGSSLLGGWAQAGFPAIAFSDRRVKTDVRKIADDPRGWGVYLFRYIHEKLKGAASWKLGYMAQEVQKVRPDAVVTDPEHGTLMVNYGALAHS